jgi:hypothetical protein
MNPDNRKKREKRESLINRRQDGKRSAHIQARYNEATVPAHTDILDMLQDLSERKGKSQQAILDTAMQLLYSHLTDGGVVGEKLQSESITSDLITLVRQASNIQAYALSILDKIESGTFALGDVSEARNQFASRGDALQKASESLGIATMPDAGQFAGEISFADEDED